MGPRNFLVVTSLLTWILSAAPEADGQSLVTAPIPYSAEKESLLAFCETVGQGRFLGPNKGCFIDCPVLQHELYAGSASGPQVHCCEPSLCYDLPTTENPDGLCQPCESLLPKEATDEARSGLLPVAAPPSTKCSEFHWGTTYNLNSKGIKAVLALGVKSPRRGKSAFGLLNLF
jgi:hypothetical protein